jgi:hypothetical protein
MPEQLLVICTENSVNLIDFAANKLWMRFNKGTNNVIHNFGTADQIPLKTAYKNGELLIAHGQRPGAGNNEGGVIWVDFKRDQIRVARQSASIVTGGRYFTSRNKALGAIASRNAGAAYTEDDDDWSIQTYRVHSVDIVKISGQQYWAVATNAGLTMFRKHPHNNIDSPDIGNATTLAVPIHDVLFDQATGDVWYVDGTNVYSTSFTNWSSQIDGGVFGQDTTKALPGTRSQNSQYRITKFGTHILIPSNEGVYDIDWPSGSFTLLYGKPGSGATHEILPDYSAVTAVAVGQDDSANDVLIVGMKGGANNHVAVVDLGTDLLYGFTAAEIAKDSLTVAV